MLTEEGTWQVKAKTVASVLGTLPCRCTEVCSYLARTLTAYRRKQEASYCLTGAQLNAAATQLWRVTAQQLRRERLRWCHLPPEQNIATKTVYVARTTGEFAVNRRALGPLHLVRRP